MAAAQGRLDERRARVLVEDEKEASALYNKGAYGLPQSGGGLDLDLTEALYLVENQRLAVRGHDGPALLRLASAADDGFETRYVVYRDLRARGFVVKGSNLTDFNTYARGEIPGRGASKHLVRCASERAEFDAASVVAEAERAAKHQKTLLLALVDEEGDLTYYEAKLVDLRAAAPGGGGAAPALPPAGAHVALVGDRALVLDRAHARLLTENGWFGRDVGLAHQLSLPEAVHLARAGRVRLDSATLDELQERARRVEPDLDLRVDLYAELRARGLVPKTGFKYGTHFRAYAGPPEEEHAPYLVHAVRAGRRLAWPEVAGFVRLAHGVRKTLYFAVPRETGFAFLELVRRKP